MFRSINSKFYAIAILLVISFSLSYGILAYFLHQQNESVIIARDVSMLERQIGTLNELFHEARYWENVILSQKTPDADMRFGTLIEQIRGLLVVLNHKEQNAATKSKLGEVIKNINHYETNFNKLIQLKTNQSLQSTRMETSYRSMVSIVLNSNNPSLLKPLFNLTQFMIAYHSARGLSKYQALKLVIDSFEKKLESLKITDVRMKGYLQSFRNLLDEDYAMQRKILSINKEVENINNKLKRHFAHISLGSATLLKNKFQDTADIREEMQLIFLLSAMSGIAILLIILLLISKNIITPIRSMALVMKEVKVGNIRARFKSKENNKDEIIRFGLSFNEMLDTLEANNQKLVDYQKELEQKIDELSERELERQRLAAQLQRAEKMEAVGRLAGGVAHDLNNLLSPILGYGEMLKLDFDHDEKLKRTVDQIVQAGIRARNLVGQLLAFSRKQTLEYKPINLNNTVKEFEKLLRRTIREDIQIKIMAARNIKTIKADVGQIEQVIMNLVVNAQDAMPEGGKLIIETDLVEFDESYTIQNPGTQPGQYVMLTVSDTGCGMDEETRKNIFEPFFTTKGEQGTGLGLATVYGIAKQHGGDVQVYSEPGHGSTFKIYLPVSEEAPEEVKPSEKAVTELKGYETILLVEDNEHVRNLGHDILKRLGYELLVAENGVDALNAMEAQNGHVDLILTDVVMPDMNGKELFTKISEKYPAIRVLFMSGYTNDVIAHRGVLDEDVQFIQKPFTVQGLAAKVREVLEQD